MYYLQSDRDILIVLVYVDDILVAYRKETDLNNIVLGLSKKWEVKNLGEIYHCLSILSRFNMQEAKYVSIPIAGGTKFEKNCIKGRKYP